MMAVGVLSLVRDAAEIALWFPVFAERLFMPEVFLEVFEDDVVGPEGAAGSGVGPVGGLRPALDGLRHLVDPQ